MKYLIGLSLALLFLNLGCRPQVKSEVNWSILSTTAPEDLSKSEIDYARKMRADGLYLPLFDVDFHKYQGKPIPLNSHRIDPEKDSLLSIYPLIQLSNRVFLESDSAQLSELSRLMAQRILLLTDSIPLKEVVFDCEWTPETREAYFRLLQALRADLPYGVGKFTAVLPLHYLRYQDTIGRPPVERILLKLVNTIELEKINRDADPIGEELLRPYLMDLRTYGAEVMVGIPLGDWGILIRDNKALRFFSDITLEKIKSQGEFIMVDDKLVKVSENAYFEGEYLNRGDFIRIQNYQASSIETLFLLIQEFYPQDSLDLCLLNLEEDFSQRYPSSLIQRWFSTRK